MTLHKRTWTFTMATFASLTYVLCVAYGLIAPAQYHAAPLLEQILPGFKWITPGSFFVGLFETAFYGAWIGFAIAAIHNFYARAFKGEYEQRAQMPERGKISKIA